MLVRFVGTTLALTAKLGCTLHLVHEHVYEFCETRGELMLPTIAAARDYVHCDKRFRHGQRPLAMGDCIVACKPTDPDHRICKRITGVAGSLIELDPSADDDPGAFSHFVRVPEGHVWVTGDNLNQSLDSRSYSMVPLGLVKGKIVAAQDMLQGWRLWFGFRWIENNWVEL